MSDINSIVKNLHLDEFSNWLKEESTFLYFAKDFDKLRSLNDRTFEYGHSSESLLCDMLNKFYSEKYPYQYVVKHTYDTAVNYYEYDNQADGIIGDIVILTNTRQTYCIDLKSTNENFVGSITWPSPLNFGSDSINTITRERLYKDYGYDHTKTLDNHIYILANTNFETMIPVKATSVYSNWESMKRYYLKNLPFVTFYDNRRGFKEFSNSNTNNNLTHFPGIQSTLKQNIDWKYL